MGFDSRGILRGVCNHPSCNCKEFTKRETSAKCNCGHAPTAHIDVVSGVAASGHPTYHGKDTVGLYSNVNIPSQGKYQISLLFGSRFIITDFFIVQGMFSSPQILHNVLVINVVQCTQLIVAPVRCASREIIARVVT